jgi:hypothetical protein
MTMPSNRAAAARLRYPPRSPGERCWLRFHASLIVPFARYAGGCHPEARTMVEVYRAVLRIP